MCLLITLGENLGGGHFYLAQIRTFLLCVDTADVDTADVAWLACDRRRTH